MKGENNLGRFWGLGGKKKKTFHAVMWRKVLIGGACSIRVTNPIFLLNQSASSSSSYPVVARPYLSPCSPQDGSSVRPLLDSRSWRPRKAYLGQGPNCSYGSYPLSTLSLWTSWWSLWDFLNMVMCSEPVGPDQPACMHGLPFSVQDHSQTFLGPQIFGQIRQIDLCASRVHARAMQQDDFLGFSFIIIIFL